MISSFYFFLFFLYNNSGDYMKRKVYILSFIFFIIDLVSKIFILNTKLSMPCTVINNFFYIDKVTNNGAAFSMFSGMTFLFIIIAVIVLIYIDRKVLLDIKTKLGIFSISMLMGGIIGNLLDRIIYGEVIDFLSFKFGSYSFPIFNIADSFICVGIFLLIIDFIRGDLNGNKSK